MSFLGYIILAIAKVLGLIINIYTMIVIIAALISWVNPDPYNPIVKILYGLTQPAFRLVRRCMPRALQSIRIDISPIIVLIILVILETFLVNSLLQVAAGMMR
ncbi:MAG: YggT family protein [Deltaproteobacteria bacterium]|jgi:YggT family protein|nr:YggT family protein [Deltaproteobacteria bacterium]